MMQTNLRNKILNQGKKYLVDTGSSLVYSNLVFTPIEILTTGGNIEQVTETRLKMSLLGLAISRPYGIFRNYWSKQVWKIDNKTSNLRRYSADITGNLLYYGGIYTGIAVSSGRDMEEIGIALGLASLTTMFTGRPYGMFMDYCRKKAGIEPAMKSKQSTLDDRLI